MELNQIQSFIVAAEEENITKAAEKLFISQPTLSRTIGRLEDELNTKLFDRKGRVVMLNDYGRVIYDYSKKVLDVLEEMQNIVSDMKDGTKGVVNIGYGISSNAPVWLDKTLERFIDSHPNVELNLYQMNPQSIHGALRSRQINLAITSSVISGDVALDDILWESMFTEEIGVLCSVKHRFADFEEISLEELQQERFFVNNSNSDMLTLLNYICGRQTSHRKFFQDWIAPM